MARREWAEREVSKATTCPDGVSVVYAPMVEKLLKAEHARAVRIVKAAYAQTWKKGYTNEAYREGRLNMAQELLTALQKGRA